MLAAQSSYDLRISALGVDCSNGFQDACKQIDRSQTCLSEAQNLAWKNVSIAGVSAAPPSEGTALTVAQTWLKTAQSSVISTAGAVLQRGRQALAVVVLMFDMRNAYQRCSA
jgi:hypothetical protein